MSRLRQREVDDDARCAECQARIPSGPCAACEAMICSDCGVLTKDPAGTRCICLSCARLIAAVSDRPVRSRPATLRFVAVGLLIAFAAVTLSLAIR